MVVVLMVLLYLTRSGPVLCAMELMPSSHDQSMGIAEHVSHSIAQKPDHHALYGPPMLAPARAERSMHSVAEILPSVHESHRVKRNHDMPPVAFADHPPPTLQKTVCAEHAQPAESHATCHVDGESVAEHDMSASHDASCCEWMQCGAAGCANGALMSSELACMPEIHLSRLSATGLAAALPNSHLDDPYRPPITI